MTLKSIAFVLTAGLIVFGLAACGMFDSTSSDNGSTHGLPHRDMSEYALDDDHRFYALSMEDAVDLVKEDGFNGIVVFAFAACPWCQSAIPVLDEVARATDVDVFYIDRSRDLRTDEWLEYDAAMAWWLNEQVELGWIDAEFRAMTHPEAGEPFRPNISVPHLFHIRNGLVVDSHRSTFEGHDRIEDEDGDLFLPEMTVEERSALVGEYTRILSNLMVFEPCDLDPDPDDSGCS